MAATGSPSLELPESLRVHARLIEAKQGQPRFIPQSINESLTATFAMWNLLDALMHDEAPEQNYQTGCALHRESFRATTALGTVQASCLRFAALFGRRAGASGPPDGQPGEAANDSYLLRDRAQRRPFGGGDASG
jgi:hypothetical protein